jgi:hypothetical protein
MENRWKMVGRQLFNYAIAPLLLGLALVVGVWLFG